MRLRAKGEGQMVSGMKENHETPVTSPFAFSLKPLAFFAEQKI
jgi:hypothetical protein